MVEGTYTLEGYRSKKKIQLTQLEDETGTVTTVKVYLQFGYGINILSTRVTDGAADPVFDGEVFSNNINGGDIITIIESADFIKDEVKMLLRNLP